MNWEFLDTATGFIAALLGGAAIALTFATLVPPIVGFSLLMAASFIVMMLLLAN